MLKRKPRQGETEPVVPRGPESAFGVIDAVLAMEEQQESARRFNRQARQADADAQAASPRKYRFRKPTVLPTEHISGGSKGKGKIVTPSSYVKFGADARFSGAQVSVTETVGEVRVLGGKNGEEPIIWKGHTTATTRQVPLSQVAVDSRSGDGWGDRALRAQSTASEQPMDRTTSRSGFLHARREAGRAVRYFPRLFGRSKALSQRPS